MNEHALAVLEFGETLRRVAARAGSPLGREAVLALRPGTRLEPLRLELARVGEAMEYLRIRPDWAPPPVPDARPALRVVSVEGGVLDPASLHRVGRLLESCRALEADLDLASLDLPEDGDHDLGDLAHLQALRARLPVLPHLLQRIEEVVDEDETVLDGASTTLASLRRRLRGLRSRIARRLEDHLSTLPDRIRVPDASVSIRDGRFVIPIRREGRSDVGGIVHGESASGATLFVEPPLAIRLMNEVKELELEEGREVQRILRELTGRLRPSHDELGDGLRALIDFDSLWARALTARSWGAVVPELVEREEEELRIVQGRHPLLLETSEGDVVPFDLELAAEERALVVSGPNTGGKTVLLKSIGLLHVLAQSGVVPPVAGGTRLPIVDDVFADIGDEQSIAESLSTFSAHLQNALEILRESGAGTLVLMDEMGTGTDPAEGAALARAILESLVERGARAVVTSHLGALKRLDAAGSGIVNASLAFDAERMGPTYRLRKGRPGRSYGLAIARRLGLPSEVLERAEALVDSGELEVERLLATLERREAQLAEAQAEADRARGRAVELEREAEERAAEVAERERTAEARSREEARRLLLEAREEVEDAIREVKEADVEERAMAERQARRRVEEAVRRQRERAPSRPAPRGAPAGGIAPGAPVRVLGSGTRGTVRDLSDGRVTVEVGGMRFEVPLHEVEPVRKETAPHGAADAGAQGGGGGWTAPEVTARPEVDLRGLRVADVDLALARALDGAVLGGLSELRIIHGKGTGAVKARVTELLREDPRVGEFRSGRPQEGGGGVTVARLDT